MEANLVLALALLALVCAVLASGIKVVRQSECMIIERLGSYSRTLKNGLNVIIPWVDTRREILWIDHGHIRPTRTIDLRETVLDVDKQAVITKDNVSIGIDILLYIQIVDPVKAVYEIANLPSAVTQLTQTSLRNVIGEMDLDATLVSRDTINAKLKLILDEATDKWGTKVNRVELRNITPPREIQNAMEKQMQAERERRAKVLEAEGDKQARIARSEGQRQEKINLAEGERESQMRRAEGEASAIRQRAEAQREALVQVKEAMGDTAMASRFLIASAYLEQFGKFAEKPGDKVYIPYEASAALGALGALHEVMGKQLPIKAK